MGAAALPWITGIGTAAGIFQSAQANKSASSAAGSQKELIKRQVRQYDTIFDLAKKADAGGFFDPEKKLAQMETDVSKAQKREFDNLGGGMAIAGYKPGDSEIGVRMDAVAGKWREKMTSMADQIRDAAFWNKIQAYKAADPNSLNQGINTYGAMQQNAMASAGNPAGFAMAMMPFLKGSPQSSTVAATAPTSSPYTLPVSYGGSGFFGASKSPSYNPYNTTLNVKY